MASGMWGGAERPGHGDHHWPGVGAATHPGPRKAMNNTGEGKPLGCSTLMVGARNATRSDSPPLPRAGQERREGGGGVLGVPANPTGGGEGSAVLPTSFRAFCSSIKFSP